MDGAMLIFFHPNYHQRVFLQKYAFEIIFEQWMAPLSRTQAGGLSLYP